jgi:hypothetical protein
MSLLRNYLLVLFNVQNEKYFSRSILEKFKKFIAPITNIAVFWWVMPFTIIQGEMPLFTTSVLTQSANRQNRRKLRNISIFLILFVSRKISAEMEVLEIQSE